MRILVTRPEPAASDTAARLEALGHTVMRDPMLRIAPTADALPPGPFDAVAFTSLNAVAAFAGRAGHEKLLALPAFAVGPRTASAAAAAGFARVTACAGDASSLAAVMSGALPAGTRVLHAAGADRAADLGLLLAPAGIPVRLCVLYAAEPAARLSASAAAALAGGTLDAALHFSKRTVQALLRCVAAAGLQERFAMLRALCLSRQVAEPLMEAGIAVEIAAAPSEDALLALL